jgi:hypothetical protein
MMTAKSATSHTATDRPMLALLQTAKQSAKIEESVKLKAFTYTDSLSAHDKLFCNFYKKKPGNLFHEMCFKKYGKK